MRITNLKSIDKLNPGLFIRSYCQKCVTKENKKCKKFYQNLYSTKSNKVEFHVCPYGYYAITFADQVALSVITRETNIVKLKRRDNYGFQKKLYESYDVISNEIIDAIEKYNQLYFEYEAIRPLLHDISNSIGTFLGDKKFGIGFHQDLEQGYNIINDQLNNIKRTKSKELSMFSMNKNYDDILKIFRDNVTKFYQKIKDMYLKSESVQGLNDNELTIISGYALYNTLIDYYERIDKGIELTTHNHNPHKMLKKLSRMLSVKARKRSIEIIFTENSHNTRSTINNISDIYIAFFSLLENAIKHSKKSGTIVISIEDLVESIKVVIKNECDTLMDREIENIHQLNYIGTNAKNSDSSGYGLYLVKQIFDKAKIKHYPEYVNGEFVYTVYLTDYV